MNGTGTCSDATPRASNSATSPWCTIGRATWGSTSATAPNSAEAARAGDTVEIAAGTYSTACPRTSCASGTRWEVCLNPANSGMPGRPITFRGVGRVRLQTATGFAGPLIGAQQRSHLVWSNFFIDDATVTNCADTGSVVLHEASFVRLERLEVKGRYTAWSDNYNAIRIEAADDNVITDNLLYDVTGNAGHNDAAIMMYDSSRNIIENNTIRTSVTGIYVKGQHTGFVQENNIFRRNLFEGMTNSAIILLAAIGSKVTQNVVKDCNVGVKIYPDPVGGRNVTLANNTIVRSGQAAFYVKPDGAQAVAYRVWNNVGARATGLAVDVGETVLGELSFEHNLWFGTSGFGSVAGANVTFAQWQATPHLRDAAPPAGQVADPLFVDEAGGNFRLANGSPAAALGVDVADLDGDGNVTELIPAGAYVTGQEQIGQRP